MDAIILFPTPAVSRPAPRKVPCKPFTSWILDSDFPIISIFHTTSVLATLIGKLLLQFLTTLNIKNTFSYAYVTFSHPPWKCYSPDNTDYSSLFPTQNINEKLANGSQYNVSEIYTSKRYDFKNLMTILTVLSNGIPFTEEKNQGSQERSFAQVGAGDDDCRNYICHSWGQCSLLNQRPHVQVILITEGLRASIPSPLCISSV